MLTLNDLANTLARVTGCDLSVAEVFLRELFSLSARELESEGVVDVPCLGRFAVLGSTVEFFPDEELATTVNAPFADFSPVELPDGFTLEGDEKREEEIVAESTEEIESEAAEPETEIIIPAYVPEAKSSSESDNPVAADTEPVMPPDEPVDSEPAILPPPVSVKPVVKKRGLRCCWALLIGLLCALIGFIVGWFACLYYPRLLSNVTSTQESVVKPMEMEDTVSVVAQDSIVPPVEEIEPPYTQVLDTIRSGYFLTSMARRHYGQKDYWVYIYEANADRLGNPDLLNAGTILVIPPADSLGIEVGNPDKIEEAKRIAGRIYARFN